MFMLEHWRAAHRLTELLIIALASFAMSISFNIQVVDAAETGNVVPRLGVELSPAEIDTLPKHVFSDGAGLPGGSGTTERGAELYAEHCSSCHGSVGQGGKAIELIGDRSLLATEYPDKGIGVYWPYAPTLYEYIHRSMPPANPASFNSNELYSLVAHLLEMNGLVDKGQTVDAKVLQLIEMPNRTGFITIAR